MAKSKNTEMEETVARWEAESKQEAEQSKQAMYPLLRQCRSIAFVHVEYDGYGDSGSIENLTYLDKKNREVKQGDVCFRGRNGFGFCCGLEVFLLNGTIELTPITSKGNLASCSIHLPLEHLDHFIAALESIRKRRRPNKKEVKLGRLPGRDRLQRPQDPEA